MQIAFQHKSRRRSQASGDDVLDLVLLDAETGERRKLVDDVRWASPAWSADGRRVRYELRHPERGFVWRQVHAETGEVTDFVDDAPTPALPTGSDAIRYSPARKWLAYRRGGSILVARADGSHTYPLTFGFGYFADGAWWSPCGTRLALGLTAGDDTGVYVLDLRTGEHRRLSAQGGDPAEPSHSISGWSPDGRWLAVTKTRWHDPATYDYEWNELWLMAADGSATRQLTDDGACLHPAIRPTGAAGDPNGEGGLTFAWAKALRTPNPHAAGTALLAELDVDLVAGPPFAVRLTVRTPAGTIRPRIDGCKDIPDGFAKLDAFLESNGFEPDGDFTVVFPRYATDDPDRESTSIRVAGLVFDEAEKRRWIFDRDAPEWRSE